MKPSPDAVRALLAWTQVLDDLLVFEQAVAAPGSDPDPVSAVRRVEEAVARAVPLPIPSDDHSHTAEALRLVLIDVHAALDGLRALSSHGDAAR